MKTQLKFSTLVKSAASLLVLGGFIWLAAASDLLGVYDVVTKVLPDGRYEATESYVGPLGEFESVDVGNRDDKGFWNGNVDEKVYRTTVADGQVKLSRSGPYVDGYKHGNWTVTDYSNTSYPEGKTEYLIYDHDRMVGHWKIASNSISVSSAFEIIQAKNFPFLQMMKLFDLTDAEIRTYTDSLEAILSRTEFDSMDFDQNYSDATYELNDNPDFDSISNVSSTLTYPAGLYRLKRNELRLAVLDRNRNGSGTTYACVASTHPGYLAYINTNQVTNPEFDLFCHQLDSTMDSYGPLNRDDAFFVDSVDVRLYRALSDMSSGSPFSGRIPEVKTDAKIQDIKSIRNKVYHFFKQLKSSETSTDPALSLCIAEMFIQYDEADILKAAVREACFLKKKWAQLPVLTTVYSGSNSKTSVTVTGNIIESAGSEVTARGIAWADTYNPTVENHVLNSGSGLGIFHVNIDGLEAGKTYYARSFAVNRAGTAYGNLIEFTTQRTSSANNPVMPSLQVSVYPNPASQSAMLNYTVETAGNYTITLLNMNGQVVGLQEIGHLAPGIYHTIVDVSYLPEGVYLCRVSNSKLTSVCRLIITE